MLAGTIGCQTAQPIPTGWPTNSSQFTPASQSISSGGVALPSHGSQPKVVRLGQPASPESLAFQRAILAEQRAAAASRWNPIGFQGSGGC
jgi:hypothetical protein